MQLFCDNLCLIWNCRPQNLSLSCRQSPLKTEVLPQPEGYQTQRSILQRGFPSHYIIAVMAGVCVGGEKEKFRTPAETRQSIKSRLKDQEESKHRESGCGSPMMGTFSYAWGGQGSSWGTTSLFLKLLFVPSFHWQRKTRNKTIYLACQNGLLLQWNDKTCR